MSERSVLMVANFSRRGNGPAAYVPDLINSIKEIAPNIRIDVLIGAQGAYAKSGEVCADNIFRVETGLLSSFLLKVPKLRVLIWNHLKERYFQKLLNSNHYDYVVFHSIQPDTDILVSIAKQYGSKVLLFPWGSEVIRVHKRTAKRIKTAFDLSDYIRGDSEQFVESIIEKNPSLNKDKFVNLTYASPCISSINKIKGKLTREEMVKELSLPADKYYVVCGYSAAFGHQHRVIIEQLAKCKSQLPHNYLLVFPITYATNCGVNRSIIEAWCNEFSLENECLDTYLSDHQMACLHLVSDLYINIQITDMANSFIMESLYAGTKVINGAWLKYPELERFGVPYYLCKNSDTLNTVIISAIKDKGCHIPEPLYNYLTCFTWPVVAHNWCSFINANKE